MRISITAVGRMKAGPKKELVDGYLKRLSWPTAVREVTVKKGLEGEALKNAEAEALLGAVAEDAYLIALDERGNAFSSDQLAERLSRFDLEGVRDVAFLIGGAAGHGRAVLDRAALTLSFGPQTWPHMLVRVMLAEQLYRAESILKGHPYHRR